MTTSTQRRIAVWAVIIAIVAVVAVIGMYHPNTPAPQPVPTPALSTLPLVYQDSTAGFSIHYPVGYTADASYTYQELGPGKDISGVKFTIPASVAAGTNLSSDSYISVEKILNVPSCSASLFLDTGENTVPPSVVTDNGTTYSFTTSTGAGAGNRYEETVYALANANPCIAVRYFIHYGVIENYPVGAVVQFDEQSLKNRFDAIRRTLVISGK